MRIPGEPQCDLLYLILDTNMPQIHESMPFRGWGGSRRSSAGFNDLYGVESERFNGYPLIPYQTPIKPVSMCEGKAAISVNHRTALPPC